MARLRGKLWPALVVAATLPWWWQVALELFVPPPGVAPQVWDVSHRHQLVEGLDVLDSKLRGVSESSLPRRAESAQDGVAQAAASERSQLVQAWGVAGVVLYLSYGVFKVVPIVLDGLGALSEPWQWGLLVVTLLFFAYVEGYRGFQLGFSPRVVSRAWVVSEEIEEAPVWHKVLAPAFCIGYFHGTDKRVITSWAVTTVIFAVVIGVKQLDNPYRAIIDAGVIVGLMWGILSIIVLYLASLQSQKPPEFDPALPEDTPYTPLN
mmetsp:Transcript_52141/g.106078  ORF Transcript_52141/g.106078 Transcript_52141/m.106078 type:complete len:264 (-) Transcript_52141:86-877(-)